MAKITSTKETELTTFNQPSKQDNILEKDQGRTRVAPAPKKKRVICGVVRGENVKTQSWCMCSEVWCPYKGNKKRKAQTDTLHSEKSEKTFTESELLKTKGSDACMISYKGSVYDVTEFLSNHPGGKESITSFAGMDCTEEFELVGHSQTAIEDMEQYRIGILDEKSQQKAKSSKLYFQAELTKSVTLSEDTIHMTFEIIGKYETDLALATGQHLYIRIQDSEKNWTSRPYTPIKLASRMFELVVKIYKPCEQFPEGGKMSQMLGNLKTGDSVSVVTAKDAESALESSNFYVSPGKFYSGTKTYSQIGLVAGGTGITPIWQYLSAITDNSEDPTKCMLVTSNHTENDILLKGEVEELLHKENANLRQVHHCITNVNDQINESQMKSNITKSYKRMDVEIFQRHLPQPSDETVIIVCGPPGMMRVTENMLMEIGHTADNIKLLGKKEMKTRQDKYVESPKKGCWQKVVDWQCRNPHLLYIVTSLLLVLSIFLIGRGRYGMGRFPIQGFKSGTYAYILPRTWEGYSWVNDYMQWIGYIPHQIAVLVLVGVAQSKKPTYSTRFRWFNWALFGVNAFFIAAKWTQTNLTYNGLSSVLPLWFGIATVAVMLMLVGSMYIVSRGIFCGCGRGKPTCICGGKTVQCTFWFEASRFMRKYHAYFIAFALINDFWYHPFESSPGHLMGILNDILLLWQSTTIYTHGHRNKWWCLLLEIMVLPHSAMIAFDRGTGASGMFGFAYFLLLVVTQQFQVQMHAAFRIILILGFLGSLFAVYGLSLQYDCTSCESLGFGRIWMTVLIPAMNYAVGAIYFPIMYWLFRLCLGRMKPSKCRTALIWLACIIVIGAIWPIFTTFARPSDDNAKIRENMIKFNGSTICNDPRCLGYQNYTRNVTDNMYNLFGMPCGDSESFCPILEW